MKYTFFLFFFILSLPFYSFSGENTRGVISFVNGNVEYYDQNKERWRPVSESQTIRPGEILRSDEEGMFSIALNDGSELSMASEGSMEIKALETSKKVRIRLRYGAIRGKIDSSQKTRYFIETSEAVVGVRGTDFTTTQESEEQTQVDVEKGIVEVESIKEGKIKIREGEGLDISKEGHFSKRKFLERVHNRWHWMKSRRNYKRAERKRNFLILQRNRLRRKLEKIKNPRQRSSLSSRIARTDAKVSSLQEQVNAYRSEYKQTKKRWKAKRVKRIKKFKSYRKKIKKKFEKRRKERWEKEKEKQNAWRHHKNKRKKIHFHGKRVKNKHQSKRKFHKHFRKHRK